MDFKGFHVPDYFFKPETDVVFLGNKSSTDWMHKLFFRNQPIFILIQFLKNHF